MEEKDLICHQIATFGLEGRLAFTWYLSQVPDGYALWKAYYREKYFRRLTGVATPLT